jgi:hypothetical protein
MSYPVRGLQSASECLSRQGRIPSASCPGTCVIEREFRFGSNQNPEVHS